MLLLVIYYSSLVIVLIIASQADDRNFAARGDRAHAAHLFRAQERWAEEMDRRHGVNAGGADRRRVA